MRISFSALSLFAFILTGCASSLPMMRSDVTTFHEWPQQLEDKSFSFKHKPSSEPSLETKAYEQLIINQMARYGFTYKASGAALLVEFEPHISQREMVVRELRDPFYSPAYMYGGFWPGWRNSSFWGLGWQYPLERSYTTSIYNRSLKLNITTAGGKRLFESRAVSEGTSKELSMIMPGLVESVFEGFPGESGKLRTVKIPLISPNETKK